MHGHLIDQHGQVNRFSLTRVHLIGDDVPYGFPTDLAVPVIDGERLSEVCGSLPGVDVSLVAPPSRHWLGSPEYVESDRAVVLDGDCGEAGCCGTMARISIFREVVRWDDFYLPGDQLGRAKNLKFVFDRREYETAIDAVLTLTAVAEAL